MGESQGLKKSKTIMLLVSFDSRLSTMKFPIFVHAKTPKGALLSVTLSRPPDFFPPSTLKSSIAEGLFSFREIKVFEDLMSNTIGGVIISDRCFVIWTGGVFGPGTCCMLGREEGRMERYGNGTVV